MNEYSLNNLLIGTEEKFTVRVTEDMHLNFKKYTGDVNPIHVDDKFAKKNGFYDVLVYGMLTASFYSTLVGVYLPGKYCILQECKTSFYNPVYIGDELTVIGNVKDIDYILKRITIKAKIINQNMKRVSKATIIVGLTKEEN